MLWCLYNLALLFVCVTFFLIMFAFFFHADSIINLISIITYNNYILSIDKTMLLAKFMPKTTIIIFTFKII